MVTTGAGVVGAGVVGAGVVGAGVVGAGVVGAGVVGAGVVGVGVVSAGVVPQAARMPSNRTVVKRMDKIRFISTPFYRSIVVRILRKCIAVPTKGYGLKILGGKKALFISQR